MAAKKAKLPKETDIQLAILNALGAPVKERKVDKNEKVSYRRIGIYLCENGMFWRNNSGCSRTAGGGFMRFGTPGSPDLQGVYHGICLGFEVKRPGGKLRPDQKQWQEWFEAAGGIYRVVHNVEEALAVISSIRATVSDKSETGAVCGARHCTSCGHCNG
jgi:hypothetical protein